MPSDPQRIFADLAVTYCDIIEGGLPEGFDDQAGELAGLLARLYAAASALPDVWDDRLEGMDEARVSHEVYRAISQRLAEVLGEHDYYWEVPCSDMADLAEEPSPAMGQLSDDLTDIWRDLEVGRRSWERGDKLDRLFAIWYWRLHFFGHWGMHLVDALKVLHRIGSR